MKFLLYARKSTDTEERQVLSIDAQLAELREFARKEHLHILRELVESQTAKEPGRPVFNEMMQSIDTGEATGIIAWHPDRLARNSVDGGSASAEASADRQGESARQEKSLDRRRCRRPT
jgi:DNA invertase Pin-like site-specific DNA recombinase